MFDDVPKTVALMQQKIVVGRNWLPKISGQIAEKEHKKASNM